MPHTIARFAARINTPSKAAPAGVLDIARMVPNRCRPAVRHAARYAVFQPRVGEGSSINATLLRSHKKQPLPNALPPKAKVPSQ